MSEIMLPLYNAHTHFPIQNADVISVISKHHAFDVLTADSWFSLGVHPWYILEADWQQQLQQLNVALKAKNVIAVGECGIDKLCNTPIPRQQQVFEKQVQLAVDSHLPMIIHNVRSLDLILSILKGVQVPVVFHGVNNKPSIVEKMWRQNYYTSFGKAIINGNVSAIASLKAAPLHLLLLETDDMPSVKIEAVYKKAINELTIAENEFVLQLEKNFKNVFTI